MHLFPYSKYCVGIVEAWEEQGYLYICSELCERGNLNDYILQEMSIVKRDKKKAPLKGGSNRPLHEVTFCTEESQEESKDEEEGIGNDIISPIYKKESQ